MFCILYFVFSWTEWSGEIKIWKIRAPPDIGFPRGSWGSPRSTRIYHLHLKKTLSKLYHVLYYVATSPYHHYTLASSKTTITLGSLSSPSSSSHDGIWPTEICSTFTFQCWLAEPYFPLFIFIFSVTRRSRSDESHLLTY